MPGLENPVRLEDNFHKVIDGAPNAMIAVDTSGSIILFNAQAELIFGYHRGEVLGHPMEMLVPERFRAAHPHLRGGYGQAPGARPMGAGRDLYALRRDGTEIPVEIGLNPIHTDTGLIILAAIVDIRERKHREEKIQMALKEKEMLLGEIHHRVKNNLQIIDSLLEMQKSQITDPATINILIESQNRVKSMAIIHQTLYQSDNLASVDLHTVLANLSLNLFLSYGVTTDRIQLSTLLDKVYLPIREAIPVGLIFNEVMSNALKHAFPGGRQGAITVGLRESGGTVTLTVSDDGVGLPDDGGTARNTLGLQLVSLLVRQISGQLTVTRAAPTCFSITFQAHQGQTP